MANVKLSIGTIIHENINLKASLKECFANEYRFINFRARTAKNNIENLAKVREARQSLQANYRAVILTF